MLGIIVFIALASLCFIIGMFIIKATRMIIIGKWYNYILYPMGLGFGVLVVMIALLMVLFKGFIFIMAAVIRLLIYLLPFAAVIGIILLLVKLSRKQ